MTEKWKKEAAALKEARQHLLAQLGEPPFRGRGVSMRESVTDLSFADNHPADLGTENFERSKDLSLRELRFSQLRQVEEALARIDAGTYGICLRCGEMISAARLEAVPEAPLCLPCREYEERAAIDTGRRPVEEELLSHPFT
ncbi:MAG: TraR/DksA C4-type zinc finger protein, partial [Bacillota bacterium]|nr:TraR/DksA C4-type zinc finger protein [Bacillota bacterium]